MRRVHVIYLAILALTIALFAGSNPASALIPQYDVDRFDDPALVTQTCTVADNDCSLRAAIEFANSNPDLTTIIVPAGNYLIEIPGNDEDANQTGDIDILTGIFMDGAGAGTGVNSTVVDGQDLDRIFDIYPQQFIGDVQIRDLTVRNGTTTTTDYDAGGAGIRAGGGDVALTNVDVLNNEASSSGGGILQGIYADLLLTNVTVRGNTATEVAGGAAGGGLFKLDAANYSIGIYGSMFEDNTAPEGGGLGIGVSSTAEVYDTSIIGNHATYVTCGNCSNGGGGLRVGATTLDFFNGTVANNDTAGTGGGILAGGTIHLSGTTITGNTAVGGAGIASSNVDSTITDAEIMDNHATERGGGATLTFGALSHSTVSGNTAGQFGGGLFTDTATVTHSTISGNSAPIGGGVFETSGTQITNSTISGNTASTGGGGLYKENPDNLRQVQGGYFPSPTNLDHITVANNSAPSGANLLNTGALGSVVLRASIVGDPVGGDNCAGTFESGDYNVDEDGTCGLGSPDVSGADPMLNALANNGGVTNTHSLKPGSPAIDLVSADCPPPGTDQRDAPRPAGGACDAGSVESPLTAGTPTPTGEPTPTHSPSPSPTVTPGPGVTRTWGDDNCSGEADPVDSLVTLRFDAGLSTDTSDCPDIGEVVEVANASPHPWGDIDCGGDVNPVDSLKLLRFDAGLDVAQEPGCPEVGSEVEISPV